MFRCILISIFATAIAVIGHPSAIAQKVLYEARGNVKDFTTVPAGDSILFKYTREKMDQSMALAVWVTDTTHSTCYVTDDVLAAINFGDEVYLYSLAGKKSAQVLNASVFDKEKRTTRALEAPINIGSNVLGSFISGKNIYIVSLEGRALSIFEINKMSVVSHDTYKLPLDSISYHFSSGYPVEFYTDQSEINGFKGLAMVKFYKYDKFYLTVDQRNRNATRLLTLDPQTKQVSMETFKSPQTNAFNSFFADGKLFQTVTGRKQFLVKVWDVPTKTILVSKEVTMREPVTPIYFRYGRKNVIHRNIKTEYLLAAAATRRPTLSVVKRGDNYVMESGLYFNKNNSHYSVLPSHLLIGLAISIIYNSIQAAREKPGLSHYLYYNYNQPLESVSINRTDQSLKEKIDNYEIEQLGKGIHFASKSYVGFKTGVLCTYHNPRDKSVSLVYFD